MSGFPPPLFLTCTTRPNRASCSTLLANFSFLVLIGSPKLLPLVLPRRVDLLVPPTERKEGADIAASPSILVALLICCSAHNTAHVNDLYPASSNPSVRFVSFRIVVISALMILVSSTRSCHACDKYWILTKPPAGIFWSRNQPFPIYSGVSCSRRRRGSYAAVGIKGASHRMLLRMNSESFSSIGLLTMSG